MTDALNQNDNSENMNDSLTESIQNFSETTSIDISQPVLGRNYFPSSEREISEILQKRLRKRANYFMNFEEFGR